jgi:hypothetical protein
MTKVIYWGCYLCFLAVSEKQIVNESLFDNGIAPVYAIVMEQAADPTENEFWWTQNRADGFCGDQLLPGSKCPQCDHGQLEYDGLFVLCCSECGYVASSGAFT